MCGSDDEIDEKESMFNLIPSMREVMLEGLDNIRDIVVTELVKKGKENWAGIRAHLGRIEVKLDRILAGEGGFGSNNTLDELKLTVGKMHEFLEGDSKGTKKEDTIRACFFCNGMDHVIRNCPDKTKCIGCEGTSHPYERCEYKDNTCDRCRVKGHHKRVHFSTDVNFRTKLIGILPNSFAHFVSTGAAGYGRAPRVGLSRGGTDGQNRKSGRHGHSDKGADRAQEIAQHGNNEYHYARSPRYHEDWRENNY